MEITETTTIIRVDSIPITVRMIDTPGFGDVGWLLDVHSSFRSITNYLDSTYERAFKREVATDRSADYHTLDSDLGVDAVLYFISPHRLKGLDMELLRRLRGRAAIIPIIAKADTLTVDELRLFRAQVTKQLADADIPVFHAPLAIIASPSAAGRTYPWGVAESENEAHSDLPTLRRLLLIDGLEDLHEARRHAYEKYRSNLMRRLRGGGFSRVINLAKTAALYTTVMALVLPQLRGPFMELVKEGRAALMQSAEVLHKRRPRIAGLPGVPALSGLSGLSALPVLKSSTSGTAAATGVVPAATAPATDVTVTVKEGSASGASAGAITGTTGTVAGRLGADTETDVQTHKGRGFKRILLIVGGIVLAPFGFLAFKPPDDV